MKAAAGPLNLDLGGSRSLSTKIPNGNRWERDFPPQSQSQAVAASRYQILDRHYVLLYLVRQHQPHFACCHPYEVLRSQWTVNGAAGPVAMLGVLSLSHSEPQFSPSWLPTNVLLLAPWLQMHILGASNSLNQSMGGLLLG